MTEQEWLECTDPAKLLAFLPSHASNRQLRLFSVGSIRLIGDTSRRVCIRSEFAEGFADDPIMTAESRRYWEEVDRWPERPWAWAVAMVSGEDQVYSPYIREEELVCVLRDIFGNPFRPVIVNPAWLAWNDNTVSRIAQCIYEKRAFDRLPILADALEDAGCGDDLILTHCRSEGLHVRGCHVLDVLLQEGGCLV